MAQTRIVSGQKPTGRAHIGNYFGANRPWVQLQEDERYECFFFIADYHAITVDWDPDQLRQATIDMTLDLLACGLDPERCVLFAQSHVPEHLELCWALNAFASYGDLTRMTQFKEVREEAEEREEFVSAGLFDYPVLQAADILMYHAQAVPVGEDQVQHVELTRRVARRFNSYLGEYFIEPEWWLSEAPRIRSLADPEKKMSKSYGAKHVIGLTEDEAGIYQKVKSAVTDVGPGGDEMSPGIENLFRLLKLTAPSEVYDRLHGDYESGSLKYVELKESLFEHLMERLHPVRERRRQLSESDAREVLKRGAEKASSVARQTINDIRERIGVGPPSDP